MKTIFAVEKSDYLHCLWKCVEPDTPDDIRRKSYARLQEIEKYIKSQGDEILTIVTTVKTPRGGRAPPMSEEDIIKEKQ